MNIGDKISFGNYEWLVLYTENNKSLIITQDIIEQGPFHNAYTDITWEKCSLRQYLNGEFYNQFSATEKEQIIPVRNKNQDNQWYGTKGGKDTEDSIFLLNLDETCTYFGDSKSKLYNPGKKQRYWFERKDENNSNRVATYKGQITWWWLRSPGRVSVKAVYVHGDGNIGIQGNNILKGNIGDGKCIGGIRPAMWISK